MKDDISRIYAEFDWTDEDEAIYEMAEEILNLRQKLDDLQTKRNTNE